MLPFHEQPTKGKHCCACLLDAGPAETATCRRIQTHRIDDLFGDSMSGETGAPERDCWGQAGFALPETALPET